MIAETVMAMAIFCGLLLCAMVIIEKSTRCVGEGTARVNASCYIAQVLDEVRNSSLRGVGAAMEHRFTSEEAADAHTVKTAHQLAFLVDLDAVSGATPVEFRVRGYEIAGDPCGQSAGRGLGALAHDALEIPVEHEGPARSAETLA